MKKCYRFIVSDDENEEVDGLPETLEEIEAEDMWLDTGEVTIKLPPEIAKYLDETGIMGLA